jgi:hypothetical protein
MNSLMSSAVKLSDELVLTARREARIASRSMTQQIEHWARIGRVVERAGGQDPKRLRAALAAELDFDGLTNEERAVVLGELEAAIFRPHGDEAVAEHVQSLPGRRSELDEQGRLISVMAPGPSEPINDVDAYVEDRRREANKTR